MNGHTAHPIRVGVIDSGWGGGAQPRVQRGRAFFSHRFPLIPADSSDVHDVNGHGTAVIRLILAIAPTIAVIPLRVFRDRLDTSPEVLFAALDWAKKQRLDLLNLSLSTAREDARDVLCAHCEQLRRTGTLVIAAASNLTRTGYPAILETVFGVGVREADETGPSLGIDMIVKKGWFGPPLIEGVHPRLTTTSSATAFVTGCIAQYCAEYGPLTLSQLRKRAGAILPIGCGLPNTW